MLKFFCVSNEVEIHKRNHQQGDQRTTSVMITSAVDVSTCKYYGHDASCLRGSLRALRISARKKRALEVHYGVWWDALPTKDAHAGSLSERVSHQGDVVGERQPIQRGHPND